jgi:prepilin signal peptidase PulO-like enzyme (type II secretory pathway)
MIIELIVVVLIGLLAGGVVNVLADDLPLRRPVRLPRYVGPDKKRIIRAEVEGVDDALAFAREDDEPRPPVAWLGITAFLFGKRVSPQGVKLSWRYPLTELLTAGLMALTLIATSHINQNPDQGNVDLLQLIIWLVYMAIFALITVIDMEHKLILFVVIIPAAVLAVLDAVITTYPPNLTEALIGGAAGFGIFFLLYNGGFLFTYIMGKLRGQDIDEVAFGYGDVMMAGLAGLILGWRALIFALFITVFLGAFGAIIYMISRRLMGARYSAYTALPYGPYIVAGTVIILLYRVPVTDFLLGR